MISVMAIIMLIVAEMVLVDVVSIAMATMMITMPMGLLLMMVQFED
jgi:hypothetical protein